MSNKKIFGIHSKYQNTFLSEENPHISVGYAALGDLSKYKTKDSLKEAFKLAYPDYTNQQINSSYSQLYKFSSETSIGDYVVYSDGKNIHVGEVISNYIYRTDIDQDEEYADYVHFRKVKWLAKNISRQSVSKELRSSISSKMSYFSLKDEYIEEIQNILSNPVEQNKVINVYVNDKNLWTCDTALTVNDWVDILNNPNLTRSHIKYLLKAWYEQNNHEASCKQTAEYLKDYGITAPYCNSVITNYCKSICKSYNINIKGSTRENTYYVVLMYGHNALYNGSSVYNWILRDEVVEAIKSTDILNLDIKDIIMDKNIKDKSYSKQDFLKEVFISEEEYEDIKELIIRKKNIILQGSPGVGKTFMAKRLAYSILGEKNDDAIQMLQFHQSYSYEDFIYGYQPTEDGGFELTPGIFYTFCKKAESNPNIKHFFILDEINRGNLSKIFGELFMLIESDKRGEEFAIPLSHSKQLFSVPENLYIIGMMNTADRSLALVDYALRRRFSFVSVKPAFSNPKFKKSLLANGTDEVVATKIIERFNKLNDEISSDASLGPDFAIGHSYFCIDKKIDTQTYNNIIKYDIKPILEEYWFDNKDNKIQNKIDELLK